MCLWKDASSQVKGFNICGFMDSRPTLEHYKTNHSLYNSILSDFRMPVVDGTALLTKVKTINPNVKTILISAFQVSDEFFQDCVCGCEIL
jgi:DNA-binding NtrC family response regulator